MLVQAIVISYLEIWPSEYTVKQWEADDSKQNFDFIWIHVIEFQLEFQLIILKDF